MTTPSRKKAVGAMARGHASESIVMLALALVLGGCGFQPMLGIHDDNSSVAGELAKIKVGYIENRSGQVLRNDLVDALNPRGEPDHPKYTLVLRILEPQQNLAFQRNNSVTNVNYVAIAYWSLLDTDQKVLFSNGSSSAQQYEISNSQYATAISAQNVRDRIMLDISSDIRNKIAQYFSVKLSARR
ncbi:MAG: hypothetical protein JO128_04160 [Alphaproteobacteria bacterium]|nr:hypothetical protein [Alphaproteobacteria bacterium]